MLDAASLSLRCGPEAVAALDTPSYIFDPDVIAADYLRLKEALGTKLIVSVKANPNNDVYARCAHVFTDGLEMASLGELNAFVGRAAVPKFVTTPALDAGLVAAALASKDTTLLLDNLEQVDLVLASPRKTPATAVGLRISAAAIASVQPDHFGMDFETMGEAARRLTQAGVAVRGLHLFAGSYSFETAGAEIAAKAEVLLDRVEALLPKPLDFLNLGGGFGEDWDKEHPAFTACRPLVAKLSQRLAVYHESGRAVFAGGGTFVTKVLAVKRIGDRTFVVCDGGIAQSFLLAQTEKVIKHFARPTVLPIGGGERAAITAPIRFVGNSCNRQDVIGELAEGVIPVPGDKILFHRVGAYHTYSPVGFLNLKLPGKHIVS